jgi:hypothetical protein
MRSKAETLEITLQFEEKLAGTSHLWIQVLDPFLQMLGLDSFPDQSLSKPQQEHSALQVAEAVSCTLNYKFQLQIQYR